MTCVAFMTLIHTKCILLCQEMPSTVAAVILIYQENSWDCQFICMGHQFLLTQFPCSELILRFMLSPFTKTFIKYLLYFSKVSGVFIKFWCQLVPVVCLCPLFCLAMIWICFSSPDSFSFHTGILACLDGYMNIAMEQTEEYVNGQLKNKYGDAFIRGNNGNNHKIFVFFCFKG